MWGNKHSRKVIKVLTECVGSTSTWSTCYCLTLLYFNICKHNNISIDNNFTNILYKIWQNVVLPLVICVTQNSRTH